MKIKELLEMLKLEFKEDDVKVRVQIEDDTVYVWEDGKIAFSCDLDVFGKIVNHFKELF